MFVLEIAYEPGESPEEDAFLARHAMDDVDLFAGTGHLGYDNTSADSRFVELQEELRSVVFTGLSGLSGLPPTEPAYPPLVDSNGDDASFTAGPSGPGDVIGFSALAIPRARLTAYLCNWVTHCAPQLDKFDEDAHFQTEVPLLARREPALLYALLAFSARQMERAAPAAAAPDTPNSAAAQHRYDSLELYQESIRHLAPRLQAKDPSTLVTACILAVFELMVGRSHDWRRHLEGCAALFSVFGVHGFSPGLGRAVFWCYARMDLCGAIMSEGSESTMLPLDKWVPSRGGNSNGATDDGGGDDDAAVRALFQTQSKDAPAVYACWAVYLCAKVCHLRAISQRSSSSRSSSSNSSNSWSLATRWTKLWRELALWYRERPPAFVPIIDADGAVFPLVFFAHYAAISSNQLYHTACILMLEMQRVAGLPPPAVVDDPRDGPPASTVWHARRVCGISCSNAHNGSWVNAIQPLYVAGTFFTHLTERLRIAQLLQTIDRATGWGALWRLRDLEAEWGFDEGELLGVL